MCATMCFYEADWIRTWHAWAAKNRGPAAKRLLKVLVAQLFRSYFFDCPGVPRQASQGQFFFLSG